MSPRFNYTPMVESQAKGGHHCLSRDKTVDKDTQDKNSRNRNQQIQTHLTLSCPPQAGKRIRRCWRGKLPLQQNSVPLTDPETARRPWLSLPPRASPRATACGPPSTSADHSPPVLTAQKDSCKYRLRAFQKTPSPHRLQTPSSTST